MKKLLFILAMATIVAACKKDDDPNRNLVSSAFDGKITGTVEQGSAYSFYNDVVNKVSAMVSVGTEELVSGTYAYGNFTITLPATPNVMFLEPLLVPDGISVSDKNVLGMSLSNIVAYDSTCYDYCSFLVYGKVGNNSYTDVSCIYVDRNVTVTGMYKDAREGKQYEGHFGLSLKKGWNMVFFTTTKTKTLEKTELTTKPVSDLKWYFQEDFYDSLAIVSGTN